VISDPEKVHLVAQMSIEWMTSVKESNPAMYKEAKLEIFTTAWDELAAHALGLGSSWSGGINTATQAYPPLIELLGLPKDTIYLRRIKYSEHA
jgi:hypothetical protein